MKRWLDPRVGFGLMAALYLLAFPYHPELYSANEICRLWTSRAIVDHHTMVLNETMREYGAARDLSCAAVFLVNGQQVRAPCLQPPPGGRMIEASYYSSKAPLTSFLGVPVYWALKQLHAPVTELAQVYFSRLFITVLPSLWLLWLLRRFLREQLPHDTADLLTVAYGLGTIAFSYAETFMSHQLTAVLLFATFYAAWKALSGAWGRGGYVIAGATAGAAVMAEYTAALTVLCLAAYVVAARWGKWRDVAIAAGLVVLGAAPFLGGLMAYHDSAYGHPLESGYRWLADPGYQHWHVGGFLGIRTPDLRAFGLSFFSPLRGLFTLSPFLLFAFAAVLGPVVDFIGKKLGMRKPDATLDSLPAPLAALAPLEAKERAQVVFLLILLGANAYFTSSFDYDSWGWTAGPRHLTPMFPFLMLPVGFALERFRTDAAGPWLSVLAGLVISSVLVVGVVCFVNYIPSDVTTSLFGLAVPLLSDGFWPVTVLGALGLANPAAGVFFALILLAAVAWVASRFTRLSVRAGVLVVALLVHLGSLRLFTEGGAADKGAVAFLEKIWLAKKGETLSFFPP